MGSSLRFGGTMELTGLDERLNRRRIQGIIQSIPEYFPDFRSQDFIDIQPWLGLRPCSPDGLPYLGRTRRFSNLVVATGHAMMGLSLAPITGRLVVDLLDGQPVDFDLTKLSPDRFG
jgi:D-amino-acid dehydrogenase